MSALQLGQINFRPGIEYELYRNSTGEPLNVTVALADVQTVFTLKCESKTKKISMSGAITLTVPSGSMITVTHGVATVMQPATVSLSVSTPPANERS